MKFSAFSAVVLAAALGATAAPAQLLLTRVEQGRVQGVRQGRANAFLGIPYAAPPMGANRWRAPRPAAAWTGTRVADHFGPNCQQEMPAAGSAGFGPWTPEYLPVGSMSEDCLSLNLWTPARTASEKLPVLVWIHGGAFSGGSSSVPVYDGAALAGQGIIVVTVNYRLGVYGFLSLPELRTESGENSSGNYGLRDQIAALQWVKRNIVRFGGDPARVTIAGQSAGAASVHDLILSPLARGLFSQAIAESGSGMGIALPGPKTADAMGLRFVQAAGATSLARLRAMTPARLSEALSKPDPSGPPGGLRFAPIADNVVIPADPDRELAAGRYNDTAILTGLNADEGSANPEYRTADPAKFRANLSRRLGPAADHFAAFYPPQRVAQSAPAFSRDAGIASMLAWADERRMTSKHPIYAYLYTHVEPGPEAARYGAFHSSEIPYVFNTLDKTPQRGFTAVDRKVASIVGRYWVNFVKTGDPNGGALPAWPRLGPDEQILELDETPAARPALTSEQLQAFRDYVRQGGKLGLF